MPFHGSSRRILRPTRRGSAGIALTALLLATPSLASARTPDTFPGTSTANDLGVSARHAVVPVALSEALAALHSRVPAFSRQTGMACSACHYAFPQLTPFGRQFKLNGYTLTGLQTIGQPGEAEGKESLKLLPSAPLAFMLVSGITQTSKAQPGTQNGTFAFPQEASVFLAGAITPNVGAFTQFTYAGADGSFGIDNVDIRYANHRTVGEREMTYGLTLNNNPTVQDVWNTVPAWGFPFMSSEAAPSPMAATMIDGGMEQQVVGVGAYSLWNQMLYTELAAYRSAPQGATVPLDASASNAISGVVPYWRVALQREQQNTSLMLGTYGFAAKLFPSGVSGETNRYRDIGVDAQGEQRRGTAAWIERATYIAEQQTLDAALAAGEATSANVNLHTVRGSVTYLPSMRYSFTLGAFQTGGTTDPLVYPSADVSGSATGSPNSSGALGELSFMPWQNTRLGLQYLGYNKFNGGSTAYDRAGGRNAGDNNTIFAYLWLAF